MPSGPPDPPLLLTRLLPRHARVLLLGAGLGPLTTPLGAAGAYCLLLDIDAVALGALTLPARTQAVVGDPARLALGGRAVDLIVAGDLPRRLPRAVLAGAIAGWAHHLRAGGHLVSEFALRPSHTPKPADRLGLGDYDARCEAADLAYIGRYSDLAGRPWAPADDSAVSLHRRR